VRSKEAGVVYEDGLGGVGRGFVVGASLLSDARWVIRRSSFFAAAGRGLLSWAQLSAQPGTGTADKGEGSWDLNGPRVG
jgi:hypothetical protein